MANAKSNIYPIQLQGAELCLNRYDAEIKQYRGFNKNNSPFVGGCLSNVFTKEEQIEGGNDDNVYIDENGDIYKIADGKFYKNDKFIYNCGGNSNGIRRRKLNPDYDVAKYFNDEIFVYKDTNYYLKYGNDSYLLDITISSAFDLDSDFESDLRQKGFCGVFIKYTNDNNYVFIFATVVNTKNIFLVIKKSNGVFTLNEYVNSSGSSTSLTFSPVGICYNSTQNQVLFFYTPYNASNSDRLTTYSTTKCRAYSINENGELALLGETSDLAASSTDGVDIISTNIKYYHVCSYPYNRAIVKVGVNKNFNGKKIGIVLRNLYYEDNVIKYTLTSFASDDNIYNAVKIPENTHLEKGTFTPLVCSYDFQMKVGISGDSNKSLCIHFNPQRYYTQGFNFSDSENGEFKICSYVLGEQFDYNLSADNVLCNLLFNNNQLSGIGLYRTLFEGWNNIDVWSLSFYNNKVYYKLNNGEWYVLEPDVLRFKKILNQIVINIRNSKFYYFNSYDLKKNTLLLFAPSYNSFFLPDKTTFYSYTAQDNNLWVAGAVNEYRQENNSSIILNPVNIYSDSSDVKSYYLGYFNFYKGEDTRVIYYKSYLTILRTWAVGASIVKKREYLINMPYPTDTNGNVEYSPTLFSDVLSIFGDKTFIKDGGVYYPLAVGNNNQPIMSYFLASGIDNLELAFIIQGQFFGVINNGIYSVQFNNGVVANMSFIVDVSNLQFVGNTPYEALFFSKTNRCLYSFTGANVLNQKQLVDKISEVRNYLYNPATQTVFLITDIGVLFYGLFGMFLLEYTNITSIFLLDNGIVMSDNNGNYRYIKYYLDEGDTDYTKENIRLETSFYGMNNEMVTINDCLYFRIFSEEHEEGDLKVSATTISLSGRKTEETTFKIKASDWDKITHTIYLRYQPKTQRGLGVAFAIDSPFKIASLSVGSQPDAVLVDKVSKGAITAPSVTTNNNEW